MAAKEHRVVASPVAARRTALIVWCVFAGLAGVLTVAAAIMGPRISQRADVEVGRTVGCVVLVLAGVAHVAGPVLARRSVPPAGATTESIALGHTAVAIGLHCGVALTAALAWMVSGHAAALAAVGIAFFGLLLALPSRRRWQALCRAAALVAVQERQTHPLEPLSPIRAKLAAGTMIGCGVLSLVALGLMTYAFWMEVVLRKRTSPIVFPMLLATLALGMSGIGATRLLTAPASKRPRWTRAYGVLVLALAAYALYVAATMR